MRARALGMNAGGPAPYPHAPSNLCRTAPRPPRRARAAQSAKAVVIAMDKPSDCLRITKSLRRDYPDLPIFVKSTTASRKALIDVGAQSVVSGEKETALLIGAAVLKCTGKNEEEVISLIDDERSKLYAQVRGARARASAARCLWRACGFASGQGLGAPRQHVARALTRVHAPRRTARHVQAMKDTLASVPVFGSKEKEKEKEEVVTVDIVWEQGSGQPPPEAGAAPAAAAPAS